MNQFVLINLTIHRFWENRLLPAPLVLRDSYVNLGYYLGGSNSLVIGEPSFTDEYLAFLEQHGGKRSRVIRVPAYSQAGQWAEAVVRELPQNHKIEKFIFAGISDLELAILKEAAPHVIAYPPMEDYRQLNRKSSLQRIAMDLGIPMPPAVEISATNLDFIPEWKGPFLLKPDLGQSGAGQIVSNEVPVEFLKTAARLMQQKGNDPRWILQKFIDVRHNLSLFGEKGILHGALQVFYDSERSSYRHLAVGDEPAFVQYLDEATRAYDQLSGHLTEKFNYSGSLGVDAIVDSAGQVFPAVDLNVRMDKSRMIFAAAKFFSIPPEEIDSYGLRGLAKSPVPFGPWWAWCCAELALNERGEAADGSYFYPYLIDDGEVHFFSGIKGFRPKSQESGWLRKILTLLREA